MSSLCISFGTILAKFKLNDTPLGVVQLPEIGILSQRTVIQIRPKAGNCEGFGEPYTVANQTLKYWN